MKPCVVGAHPPTRLMSTKTGVETTHKYTLRLLPNPSSPFVRVDHLQLMMMGEDRNTACLRHVIANDSFDIDQTFEVDAPFSNVSCLWLGVSSHDTLSVSHVLMYDEARDEVTRFDCLEDTWSDTPPIPSTIDMNVYVPKAEATNRESREDGLNAYETMKTNIRNAHGTLVLTGSLIGSIVSRDPYTGSTFLFGSLVGWVYLRLLQTHVDQLGASLNKSDIWSVLVSPLRMGIVAVLSAGFIQNNESIYLLPYALGFFTYKLAVIVVAK